MTPQEQAYTERAVAFYVKCLKTTVSTATREDCADLAQDIRLRALQAIRRKAGKIGDTKVQAFIFKSAFFAYRQFRRKYCTVKAHETDIDEESTPATDGETVADLASADTAKAIRQAVENISNGRNREICRMYIDGVTRTEIARRVGLCHTRVTGIIKAELLGVWLRLKEGDI